MGQWLVTSAAAAVGGGGRALFRSGAKSDPHARLLTRWVILLEMVISFSLISWFLVPSQFPFALLVCLLVRFLLLVCVSSAQAGPG